MLHIMFSIVEYYSLPSRKKHVVILIPQWTVIKIETIIKYIPHRKIFWLLFCKDGIISILTTIQPTFSLHLFEPLWFLGTFLLLNGDMAVEYFNLQINRLLNTQYLNLYCTICIRRNEMADIR